MSRLVETLLLGLIGSKAIFDFWQFLISRKDAKREKKECFGQKISELSESIKVFKGDFQNRFDELEKKFDEKIRDLIRSQLRMELTQMIQHNPENVDTILKIAERYFRDYRGNWYGHSVFDKWRIKQGFSMPAWSETDGNNVTDNK